MDQAELRAIQAPLKERYANDPEAALVTLQANGELGEGVSCSVTTGRALAEAGLHPASGGDGTQLCSGDMLLEALVACAGVTLRAVATSLGIEVDCGRVRAEGDLDFRGTMAVGREAPVGFSAIRLAFELDSDADEEELATLLKLTERYCVVFQTLSTPPELSVAVIGRLRRSRCPGRWRHIGELAKARATRRSSERADGQALAELETRPSGLPAGLEIEWLGVSGYRISCEGKTLFIDPYLSRVPLRNLLLRRPTLPDPGALDRFVQAPGEVVGVLVGHTHFDHAVDAPAIARRFGCTAYGSDSLVRLMGLHGLAEQAVEVEPYRTYELGPFEVSFTPSVHSKLLLGLAVPYDGALTCEHLDALSPNAYRCGQVWGISIAVAGVRLYHQGSANLIDDAIRERGRRRLPRRRRRARLHRGLLEADPPPPRTPRRRPHPLRQLLPPARRADGVRLQRQALRAARGDRRRQRRHRGRGAAPSGPLLGAVLGGDLLDRPHRAHRPGAEQRPRAPSGRARIR